MSGALLVLLANTTAGASGGSLSASASDMTPTGTITDPGTATSNTCTITPSGGTTPYHYAWTRQSGDTSTTISSSTAAAVSWSRSFGLAAVTAVSYWKCVVSDSASHTATVSGIQVTLEKS